MAKYNLALLWTLKYIQILNSAEFFIFSLNALKEILRVSACIAIANQ